MNAHSLLELVGVLFKEGKRRVLGLTTLFSVAALLALGVVLLLPKKYEASTLILVEASNIIKPLMEGRAVPTSISDQTAIVNQTITSKRILRELLLFGGWVKPAPARQPDPREEERLLDGLRKHIRIEPVREEMVRISFGDGDPQRTFKVANRLAEIYLRESTADKERESREAFEFIDKQVKEYADKLTDIHEKVLAQYQGQGQAATPTALVQPKPVKPRTVAPEKRLSPDELAALRAEAALLTERLNKKRPAAPRSDGSVEQYRQRVTQLQAELDRMLATFTEDHPDVKRVKRELTATQAQLHAAEQVAQQHEQDAQAAEKRDDDMAKATRSRLQDIENRIAEATNTRPRVVPGPRPLPNAATPEARIDPEMRTVGYDTALSELLRRYEATRDVYGDLLKRRENARVSMELEAQHRGFTLRIQEPAELPATASGMRLMHTTLIGFSFATLLPFGFLFAMVSLDRRVRSAQQIQRFSKVPLLVSISHAPAKREKARWRSRNLWAALMLLAVFAVYAAVFAIKLKS
jgi:polysaccharide chain length determinant protein (PEP-CTERM system associated)